MNTLPVMCEAVSVGAPIKLSTSVEPIPILIRLNFEPGRIVPLISPSTPFSPTTLLPAGAAAVAAGVPELAPWAQALRLSRAQRARER